MFKNRKRTKVIAAFLLINFLNLTFVETAMALTSGPTAPEYTSFEPFDTTDMVNLQTGDFTYNIPLLNVPSPEGGYPISMSYHAGIMPNEEASWVGLGWTLNPGAINRIVNNYPDDNNGDIRTIRDSWEGGERNVLDINGTYGWKINDQVNLSTGVGMELAWDTYQGFGVGAYTNASAKIISGNNANSGLVQFSATLGVSSYGQLYAGTGVGVMSQESQLGLSVSATTNFKSVSGGFNINEGVLNTSLGASISSDGLKPSWSIAGHNMITNNNTTGKITTETSRGGAQIPIGDHWSVGVRLNYLRYYSDETDGVRTFGSLYMQNRNATEEAEYSSLDCYALEATESKDLGNHPEPDWLASGSLPAYDSYTVTGQGISGSLEPYIFENGTLFRENVIRYGDDENKETDDYLYTQFLQLKSFEKPVNFRFKNDFSNRYTSNYARIRTFGNFLDDNSDQVNTFGYNEDQQHLAGSRDVQWFTNNELSSEPIGVIVPKDYRYETEIGNKIGGFVITNESGVSYHYTRPVYAFEQQSGSQVRDALGKLVQRTSSNQERYAYTWLLVAITGPDFVDRGDENLLDEKDWGYWVSFEYGVWDDDRLWRNPAFEFKKDIDGKTDTYALGHKQIAYLDAIRTRTHTAIFEKSLRDDAKTVNLAINTSKPAELHYPACNDGSPRVVNPRKFFYPDALLKLDAIHLISNDDLKSLNYEINDLRTLSDEGNFNMHYEVTACDLPGTTDPENVDILNFNRVIDKYDLDEIRNQIAQKNLRRISLDHSYSLSEGVINSVSSELTYLPVPDTSIIDFKGKLTLNNISFVGLQEVESMPPIHLEYDLDPSDQKNASVRIDTYPKEINVDDVTAEITLIGNTGIELGDIIHFQISGKKYWATLIKEIGANRFQVVFINDLPGIAEKRQSAACVTTKNPPYNEEFYDDWNMFKSDYQPGIEPNSARRTTPISAKSTDVWSLRTIHNSLGSKVKAHYESDDFGKVVTSGRTFNYPVSAGVVDGKVQLDLIGGKLEQNVLNALASGEASADVLLMAEWVADFKPNVNKDVEDRNTYEVRDQSSAGCGTYWADFEYRKEENITPFQVYPKRIIFSSTSLENLIQTDYGAVVVARKKCGSTLYNEDVYEPGTPYRVVGNLIIKNDDLNQFGGGLRVKQIRTNSSSGDYYDQHYSYENVQNHASSGVISYTPYTMHRPAYDIDPTFYSNTVGDDVQEVFRNNILFEKGKQFLTDLYAYYDDLHSLNRFIPGPGVMYEYVEITESGNDAEMYGKRRYQFEVFNRDMVKKIQEYNPGYKVYDEAEVDIRTWSIEDFTARIGNVLSIETLNSQDQVVESLRNNYLHHNDDGSTKPSDIFARDLDNNFSNQGVIQQEFNEYRIKRSSVGSKLYHKAVVTRNEQYPNVLLSTKHYKDGITTTTQNLEFDFYSGAPTRTIVNNGHDIYFEEVTIPAYRKYPEMGLKVNNPDNKHMLTQTTASYLYDDSKYNKPLVSGSVQTWNDQWEYREFENNGFHDELPTDEQERIWRKHKTYVYNGELGADGTFLDWEEFDWNTHHNDSKWKLTGEMTRYDRYSHALESRDIQGRYSTVHYDGNSGRITSGGANATYAGHFHTSFEYSEHQNYGTGYYSGEVAQLNGASKLESRSGIVPHTGKQSFELEPGEQGAKHTIVIPASSSSSSGNINISGVGNTRNIEPQTAVHYSRPQNVLNRSYRASVWVHQNSPLDARLEVQLENVSYTGVPVTQTLHVAKNDPDAVVVGDWILLTLDFDMPNYLSSIDSKIEVYLINGGAENAYFDDLRMHPLDASSTGYVYDDHTGQLTHILDNENFYTRYEYDHAGKLVATYRESVAKGGEVKLSEHYYNYGN